MSNEEADIRLRVAPRRERAEEWALVLVAEGLSPSVWHAYDGYVLGVPPAEAERAAAALSAYDSENPVVPYKDEAPAGVMHVYAALVVVALLLDFFIVTEVWDQAFPWIERGSADAERIVQGELWRAVTALTLHAGLMHALANAIVGAIFFSAVCTTLGAGLGLSVVLLAGAGGNLINAFMHGSLFVSVGASTAVFGAIGVLGGLGVARRRRRGARGKHIWVPIAAGLALLAMLGTAGERVDLLGHLFGFLAGGVLGVVMAVAVPRRPGARVQWALGTTALMLVVVSWMLALQ